MSPNSPSPAVDDEDPDKSPLDAPRTPVDQAGQQKQQDRTPSATEVQPGINEASDDPN